MSFKDILNCTLKEPNEHDFKTKERSLNNLGKSYEKLRIPTSNLTSGK